MTTYNFMSVLSFLDIKLLCSCQDLNQNQTWNKRRPDMYQCTPRSVIEENVAGHLLKRAIRQKSSGSGSSEKVRGKGTRKGSDKKWAVDDCMWRGAWGGGGGSEHRNTAKKINEHRITARKVNETPSPQHVFLARRLVYPQLK